MVYCLVMNYLTKQEQTKFVPVVVLFKLKKKVVRKIRSITV